VDTDLKLLLDQYIAPQYREAAAEVGARIQRKLERLDYIQESIKYPIGMPVALVPSDKNPEAFEGTIHGYTGPDSYVVSFSDGSKKIHAHCELTPVLW